MVPFYGICTENLDINPKTGKTMLTLYRISLHNQLLISNAIGNSNSTVFELKYPSGKIIDYPFV